MGFDDLCVRVDEQGQQSHAKNLMKRAESAGAAVLTHLQLLSSMQELSSTPSRRYLLCFDQLCSCGRSCSSVKCRRPRQVSCADNWSIQMTSSSGGKKTDQTRRLMAVTDSLLMRNDAHRRMDKKYRGGRKRRRLEQKSMTVSEQNAEIPFV